MQGCFSPGGQLFTWHSPGGCWVEVWDSIGMSDFHQANARWKAGCKACFHRQDSFPPGVCIGIHLVEVGLRGRECRQTPGGLWSQNFRPGGQLFTWRLPGGGAPAPGGCRETNNPPGGLLVSRPRGTPTGIHLVEVGRSTIHLVNASLFLMLSRVKV